MLLVVIFKRYTCNWLGLLLLLLLLLFAVKHQGSQKCSIHTYLQKYLDFILHCCHYWWAAAPCSSSLSQFLYHPQPLCIVIERIFQLVTFLLTIWFSFRQFGVVVACICCQSVHRLFAVGCGRFSLDFVVVYLMLLPLWNVETFEFSISAVKVFNAMWNVNIPSVPLEFMSIRKFRSKRAPWTSCVELKNV